MLVRFPLSKYRKSRHPCRSIALTSLNAVFVHVLLWGVVVASTAGAHNFKGLITARFFLGLFEATVGPYTVCLRAACTD